MIRMSKEADYGMLLLTQLIRLRGADSLSARELADRAGLPQPIVSKVLKALTREGLLVSQRGANGGYSLARDPRQISVAEVVAAVEGPFAMTECLENEGDCRQQSVCPVKGNWERINEAVYSVLARITLEDMQQPFPEPLVPLAGVTSGGGRRLSIPERG